MRIYHKPTGREAKPRAGKYKCFPVGRNEIPDEKPFDTPEEAAIFLLRNPDWKIWVAGNGTHSDGQVKNGLVIDGTFDFDDLKRRGFL